MQKSVQNIPITHDAGGPVPVDDTVLDRAIEATQDAYAGCNPIDFATKLGPAFARSKWFGCDTDEEGQIVALTCCLERITPLQYHQTYHTIKGRPTKKTGAMLIDFRRAGGRYEIHQYDDEIVDVSFTFEGKTTRIKLTLAECLESRWPWIDADNHDKGLKANWSTKLDRKNMIWSRLISDSLRRIAPEVTEGIYTPEEMQDLEAVSRPDEQFSHPVFIPTPGEPWKVVPDGNRMTEPVFDGCKQSDQPVVKLVKPEGELVGVKPYEFRDKQPAAEPSISTIQDGVLTDLFHKAGLSPVEVMQVLGKRGVKTIAELTAAQADELINKLTQRMQSGN